MLADIAILYKFHFYIVYTIYTGTRGEKGRRVKMLHTDIQTDRQTYRTSDEAGPRGAFAPITFYFAAYLIPISEIYSFSMRDRFEPPLPSYYGVQSLHGHMTDRSSGRRHELEKGSRFPSKWS